jgi:hypothetical protein
MIQSTFHAAAYGLLLLEVLVNIVVIHRVKYTEIDWIAYMQARPENFFQNKNRKYKFVHSVAQQTRIFFCEAEFVSFIL